MSHDDFRISVCPLGRERAIAQSVPHPLGYRHLGSGLTKKSKGL